MAKRVSSVDSDSPSFGVKPESRPSSPPRKAGSQGKKVPWTFPKNSLENAIAIAKAIEDKYGGKPIKADLLAKAVGFNKPNDWRFQDLLRSASLYGLVSGTGATATVELAEIGENVVAPSLPEDRKKALLSAFHNVTDFRKVDEHYGTKRIPEDEYFINTLVRNFNISRDRADVFAEVFRANVTFLRSFSIQTGAVVTDEPTDRSPPVPDNEATPSSAPIARDRTPRDFLDTCFVMMPFGSWFDRYYQDVYVPAIKDAGLDPVRAD